MVPCFNSKKRLEWIEITPPENPYSKERLVESIYFFHNENDLPTEERWLVKNKKIYRTAWSYEFWK